jgi:TRAP-type C4-dicarboxylate transport system substrate-binding protein
MNQLQMMSSGDPGVKEIEYLCLPYLFDSLDKYTEFLESEVGQKYIEQGIAERNTRIIDTLPRSPRIISSNIEINSLADMKNMKIRSPEKDYYVETFKALGANPTPMAMGEIYSAMQTGVVEGQENPIETYYAAGLCEVQSHTMLTSHINTFYTWAVNCDFYDSLPEEYQKAFDECAAQALKECNDGLMERQDAIVEKMVAEGHTIIEVDKDAWREAAMDSIIECADTLAPIARDAVYAQLGIEPKA